MQSKGKGSQSRSASASIEPWDCDQQITSTYRATYGGPKGVDATSWTASTTETESVSRSVQRQTSGSAMLELLSPGLSNTLRSTSHASDRDRAGGDGDEVTSKITTPILFEAISEHSEGHSDSQKTLEPSEPLLPPEQQQQQQQQYEQAQILATQPSPFEYSSLGLRGDGLGSESSRLETSYSAAESGYGAGSVSIASVSLTTDGEASSAAGAAVSSRGYTAAKDTSNGGLASNSALTGAGDVAPETPAVDPSFLASLPTPPADAASPTPLPRITAVPGEAADAADHGDEDDDNASVAGSSSSPMPIPSSNDDKQHIETTSSSGTRNEQFRVSHLQRIEVDGVVGTLNGLAGSPGGRAGGMAPQARSPVDTQASADAAGIEHRLHTVACVTAEEEEEQEEEGQDDDDESDDDIVPGLPGAGGRGGAWSRLERVSLDAEKAAVREELAAAKHGAGSTGRRSGSFDTPRLNAPVLEPEPIPAYIQEGLNLDPEAVAAAHEVAALLSLIATGSLQEQRWAAEKLLNSIQTHGLPVCRAAADGISVLQAMLDHKDAVLRTCCIALLAEIFVLEEAQAELASAPTSASKLVGRMCKGVAAGEAPAAKVLTVLTRGEGDSKSFFLAACAQHKAMRLLIDAATNKAFLAAARDNSLEALESICRADPSSGYKKLGWGGGLAQLTALLGDSDRWPAVTRLLLGALSQDRTLAESLCEPALIATMSQFVASPEHPLQLQESAAYILACIAEIPVRRDESTQALIDCALPRACEVLHETSRTSSLTVGNSSSSCQSQSPASPSKPNANGLAKGSPLDMVGAADSRGQNQEVEYAHKLQGSCARLIGNLASDSEICCHVIIFHTVILKTVVSVLIKGRQFMLAQQLLRASAAYASNADKDLRM